MKTVEIGGRCYPVSDLICPPYEGDDQLTVDERRMGDGGFYSDTFLVPAENGAVFNVEHQCSDGRWWLSIWSPVCSLFCQGTDDPMWLPTSLMVDTDRQVLRPHVFRSGYPWSWADADPEWIAESIDRWGRWPVVDLGQGPWATISPLKEDDHG